MRLSRSDLQRTLALSFDLGPPRLGQGWSLALPAALSFLPGFATAFAAGFAALIFAHRALAPARILAIAARLSFRFFGTEAAPTNGAGLWRIRESSRCRASILSLIAAACLSCCGARFMSAVSHRMAIEVHLVEEVKPR